MQGNIKEQTICIKTNDYQLKCIYQNDSILMSLIQNPARPKKQFQSLIKFINIPKQIRDKLLTLQNFFFYLSDKQNITVDCNRGTIGINFSVKLGNGKIISTTKLGQILLTEIVSIKDPLQIMKLCKGQQKLSQQKVKQILYGMAQNFLKIDIKNAYQKKPDPQVQLQQQQDIKQVKQKINAIIINLSHYETEIKNMKTNNQKMQKFVASESKNWGANTAQATLRVLTEQIDKKIQIMKKKMLQQLNYTIGQIQTQVMKLNQKIIPSSQPQKSYNNTFSNEQIFNPHSILKNPADSIVNNSYKPYLSTNTNTSTITNASSNVSTSQNAKGNSNPAPLSNKGTAQTINNMDQIHNLIRARTNKKMKKISKSVAYFKVNKKDNFLNYFQFGEDGSIKYLNRQNKRVMMFGTQTLMTKNIFSFRIGSSKQRCLGLGIVDSTYSKQSVCRVPQTRPNMIYYEASSGKIFEGPNYVGKQSIGVNQGQILVIYVNLQLGLIAWVVNGEIKANYITSKIVDHSIQWVPLVIFNHCDDTIELFEEDK